ncbi:MAG TPA: hypothetical protein PJ986_04550 [Gammaproteobacteria bacterium]|nr:hypothetical protein [Gammaproteobacteria bacterium]
MGIQTDTNKRSGFVCYTGSREELIAAGVAVDAMFPPAPRTRRYWTGMRTPPVADHFKTTKVGALWRVSRELGWEDQDYIREQHAAREAEREASYKGYLRGHAEVLAAQKIARQPRSVEAFRDAKLRALVPLWGDVEPAGGYSFDDATVGEIRDLVLEIAALITNAEVRFSPAKRLMAEAELRAPLLAEAEGE